MRRRARTDRNHGEIRDALRKAGWFVFDTSGVGSGFPDLVGIRWGRVVFIEVKDGTRPPSERALTEKEAALHATFLQNGVAVRIVGSVDEALHL